MEHLKKFTRFYLKSSKVNFRFKEFPEINVRLYIRLKKMKDFLKNALIYVNLPEEYKKKYKKRQNCFRQRNKCY